MATSGTDNFNPDILDLIEDAYDMIGIEVRGGYDLKTARRSLDMLMREWGNRGINLWTVIRQIAVVPSAGDGVVELPSYIIDLLDAAWRTDNGLPEQRDMLLQRVSMTQYANMADKNRPGTPSQYHVRRMEVSVNFPTSPMVTAIRLWPVPESGGQVVYWGIRYIQDAGTYTNTMNVPPRFLPALVAGLAYYLAIKSPSAMDRIPMLQAEYERQWQLAAEEDRDKTSFFMVPDMSSYNR